jgi:hypothetical protein
VEVLFWYDDTALFGPFAHVWFTITPHSALHC